MELKNFKLELTRDSKVTLLKNFKLELTRDSKVTSNLEENKKLTTKYIVKRKKRIDEWL